MVQAYYSQHLLFDDHRLAARADGHALPNSAALPGCAAGRILGPAVAQRGGVKMTASVSNDAVLATIEHVYAAGCDPAQWREVIERCQRLFPGTAFSLLVMRGNCHEAPTTFSG
jgi:hypothetical protein